MRIILYIFIKFVFGATSLFAAKAGASRVIAVEASEKMAAVATQVKNLSIICFLDSVVDSNIYLPLCWLLIADCKR